MRLDANDYSSAEFVALDLDRDGNAELIIASNEFYSGGRAYLILQERGKVWCVIGEIQGGFVLSVYDSDSDYYTLKSYYRAGDTYQNFYKFSRGKYRLVTQTLMPRAITDSPWWECWWGRLNGDTNFRGRNKC